MKTSEDISDGLAALTMGTRERNAKRIVKCLTTLPVVTDKEIDEYVDSLGMNKDASDGFEMGAKWMRKKLIN